MRRVSTYFLTISLFLCLSTPSALALGGKPLGEKEVIQFYPSYGAQTRDGWRILVQGRAYEPSENSAKRKLLIKLISEAADLDDDELKSEIFKERVGVFLSDGADNRLIELQLGSNTMSIAADDSGYINFSTTVAASENPFHFTSLPSKKNHNQYKGSATLVSDTGFSIISDIDDTVKITNVRDRKELLRNTFVRPFRAAPGMAALYKRWQNELGKSTQLHFLSGSPWQLFQPLSSFLRDSGFSEASWHLRTVDLSKGLSGLSAPPEEFKIPAITKILKDFPHRKFILVGDSGEKDPEIYAEIMRGFPEQVHGVYIRNVTNEPQSAERYKALYPGHAADRLFVFIDPARVP